LQPVAKIISLDKERRRTENPVGLVFPVGRKIMRGFGFGVVLISVVLLCGTAFGDIQQFFTLNNGAPAPDCQPGTPCGTVDVALGTGSQTGDLVITVQLSGPAAFFQLDKFGFDSNDQSLTLDCFSLGASCSSGVGGAALSAYSSKGIGGYGPFGKFDYELLTGLNGGSGCDGSNGSGCKTEFTFVVSDGGLTLSDWGSEDAAHAANSDRSGYIATGQQGPVPEPPVTALLACSALLFGGFFRRFHWSLF
jgi:hypothetical protein